MNDILKHTYFMVLEQKAKVKVTVEECGCFDLDFETYFDYSFYDGKTSINTKLPFISCKRHFNLKQ